MPLWMFGIGMGGILFSLLFYPAIGTATTQLNADTAAYASNYWGFTGVVAGARLWLFVISIFLILFGIGTWWLKRKN